MRIHPAVIAQAAATSAVLLDGPLQPRRRQRRGAQRAHPRRPLARGRRAAGDARGGGRGHPHAVGGRPAEPPRPPLHGRERARLRPPGRARRRCSCPASGRRRSSSRRGSATASCTTSPDKDAIELYRSEGGTGPVHAGTKVCFMARRGRGARDRAPAVAQRGAAGRARAGPADAGALRAGCELVTPDELIARRCGPDLDAHVAVAAGVRRRRRRRAYVQQIGPEQDAFFAEWASEVLPRFD